MGLIACVGQYFHQLLPRIPYPAIAAFFAVASMLVSNLGLAAIIRLSTPVLNAIYPAAIVLILLSFMPGLEKHRAVYPLCMGLTALQSIAAALPLGAVSAAANALPLGSMGFGWVLPALAGLAGMLQGAGPLLFTAVFCVFRSRSGRQALPLPWAPKLSC